MSTSASPPSPYATPSWRALQFALYVILWTASAICVRWEATQVVHANPLVMALAIELAKLIFSAVLLTYSEGFDGMLNSLNNVPRATWLRWSVPAVLYVLYNRLMFLVLGQYFEPTVYRLLSQQQIVWTAVLCWLILSQRLSRRQWSAVVLLTIGVCLLYVDELKMLQLGSIVGPLIASVSQTLCSAFAGVYIEALLRGDQKTSIHLTNLVLYIWTCSLLFLWVLWQRPATEAGWLSNLYEGSSLASHLVIIFSASAGIATSTFLRYLGAMWKEFARSAEVISVSLASFLFLHTSLHRNLIWAFPLITFANLQYNGLVDIAAWCPAIFGKPEEDKANKEGAAV